MKRDDHPGRYEMPSDYPGLTADGKTKQGVSESCRASNFSEFSPGACTLTPFLYPN